MKNTNPKPGFNGKQFAIWMAALVIGGVLGSLGITGLNNFFNFIATVFTRLFQFVAVPTIALTIATTLAELGARKNTGKIFLHAVTYTLLTTLVAAAVGLTLAMLKESENVRVLTKAILGLQEVLFALIRALVWALPLGIVAFAGQLSAQMSAGVIIGSLGKYVAVVLGGNVIQFFIILPLFLLCRGINPLKVFRNMLPAVLMALFTKSSAATLPVTIASAENNMNAKPEVARVILPLCCTINMNGCAAFILVTSMFVMQNSGLTLTLPIILIWMLISVIAAVGNAGVPMGCYFLTLSLMAGAGAPIGILGIILPIYTIIDMIETSVNVWSDSCVCAMVDKSLTQEDVA